MIDILPYAGNVITIKLKNNMLDKDEIDELKDDLAVAIGDRYNVNDIDEEFYYRTISDTVDDYVKTYNGYDEDGYVEDYSHFQDGLLCEALINLGI